MEIALHSEADFAKMRKAGRLAAETLDHITPYIVPGITTLELNDKCQEFIERNGAIPAPLGYRGYPKATCISLNHVICHGIPDNRKLIEGDILNIDVTVILDGWYGDTSRMYWVGDKISVKGKKLTEVTYECLMKAINIVKPGTTLGDIGYIIENHAHSNRFSVVTDFCGHGTGRVFHCAPSVIHTGNKGEGLVLKAGMIFTIEPMINAGRPEAKILADGWTAVTRDKSLSAQFEHTIGVTEKGCEIFTLSPKGLKYPPYNIA